MDSALAADANAVTKLAAYWKAVATYFKKYPADKLFFEVYNEPHASAGGLTTKNYSWWQNVQGELIATIRTVTADHYIIAGGEGWNSIDGLKQIQPYAQAKIIYNFHFYEPFVFTHQGATWVDATWALLHDVPYPSTPENVAPLIAASNNTAVKNLLTWYGSYRYNKDSLDKLIKVAADWGAINKVPLICNEFGSYKPFAAQQSRINCITDVRSILEKYNIGWAMWEYDEGFGLIDYPSGNRDMPVADNTILKALGL
jgi:aryl-phospho-beta-D-glucosidase BglC (GH1 family)